MSGNIHGLSWLPNCGEKFVTWGQEIKLYEVRPSKDGRSSNLNINFLATEHRYQYARCVQASYHKDRPIVAVGLGDGKICIRDFLNVESSLEYTPSQQRTCLCLVWNELEPNILAIGHDRHRSDSCITIWDIEHGLPKESANFYGLSESAHSMCFDKSRRVLIAGMSQKQIKVFDLRQSTACQSVQTKKVHGLGVSTNGNYLCSYVDSVIMLWDMRFIDRQLKQIQSAKNHLHIAWCPTRSSLLSSLQRESPYVTLFDVRSVDIENSHDVYHVKSQLLPFHSKYADTNREYSLASFSWHSNDFERALVLSDAGNILDFRVPLPTLTAHSNHKKLPLLLQRPLTINNAPNTTNSNSNSSHHSPVDSSPFILDVLDQELLEKDLVPVSYQRALNDYGVKTDFKRFGDVYLNAQLKNIWYCLGNLYRDERLSGLKSMLGVGKHTADALMSGSSLESRILQWPDFINNSNHVVSYKSEQRDVALKLCGWVFEQDLDRFITTLRDNKEFSRAAMICVFHLKILTACNILAEAAEQTRDPSMFSIATFALKNFNGDRSAMWRNQRYHSNMLIHDGHLRALFAFLTAENDNFDAVLHDDGISMADRISFACKYLSESKLSDYVKQQIQKSIERGDLHGLLLTGESNEGINILQSYLDASFDIQTVALIAINYFHRENSDNERIQYWISSYLDILNSWGLWEKRAELEIKIENIRSTSRSSRNVFLSCNFCGKSVSNALQEDVRMRSASSNINKLSSCPSCRKPLPRCELCLLHMGTALNTYSTSDSAQESQGWLSKPFSRWFSWCQTCRHGGHTEHIQQWFKQNSECPVASCSCKCLEMDATILNNVREIS